MRKAGKVMRLNMAVTTKKPKMDEAKTPVRFCAVLVHDTCEMGPGSEPHSEAERRE